MAINRHQAKLGKREQVVRHDGNINVYEFMTDPTLTSDELSFYKRIEYIPARWVLVAVLPAVVSP